ncbi:solute carrier organic anion transporter family member 5A1-like [Amphiura filiformis]|uniref:solute carrier organic anion transporter family member 5A1-like n=1 Tax=Amphiura filiformis TaxID=82378 RepID=UPI003B22259F
MTEDSTSASCGCGPCSPSWARRFASPKVFVVHAGIMFGLSVLANTYLGGVISTIERAFQISSSTAGALLIVDDVVQLVLIFFVSYFGHNAHRPRILAVGGTIYGIGMIISAMPHYATEPLDPASVIFGSDQFSSSMRPGGAGLCSAATDFGNISNFDACDGGGNRRDQYISLLSIGRAISGAGSACINPLIFSYLDDGVSKEHLTTYTTILLIFVALGAPVGYFLSAQTTSLYVDFDRVPAESIPGIPQFDPRWIGAWWLGFLACGFFWILLALPMCLYPKELPRSAGQKSYSIDVKEKSNEEKMPSANRSVFKQFLHHVKGVLKALKRLVTNVPLMFLCVGAIVDTATLAALANFLIKTLEVQFVLSPALASIIFGMIVLGATLLSHITSGIICRMFKLESYGCAVFILICNVLAALMMLILMFVGCSNRGIAGVNVPYTDLLVTGSARNEIRIDGSCNANCSCPSEIFRPVCGSDALTYISPCHAGCTTSTVQLMNATSTGGPPGFLAEMNTTYFDCQCIMSDISMPTESIPLGTATSGQCIGDCDTSRMLTTFLVLVFIGIAFGTMVANPFIYINMRVVDEEDRSVALAFKQFIANILGSFPTSVYFGAIINSACIYWQRSCGERGSCWLYDIEAYREGFFGTLLGLRILYILCMVVVAVALKRQARSASAQDDDHSSNTADARVNTAYQPDIA